MAPTLVGGIVQEAGSWLSGLALPQPPFLVAPGDAAGGVEVGDREELQLRGGETRAVKVLAVDTISHPPRAKVECLATKEVLTVPVYQQEEVGQLAEEVGQLAVEEESMVNAGKTTVYQDYEDNFSLAHATSPERCPPKGREDRGEGDDESRDGLAVVIEGLREEWEATVQDFQQKGAVGALRDAALDACDVMGSVANVAAGTARALAGGMSSNGLKEAVLPVVEERVMHPEILGS